MAVIFQLLDVIIHCFCRETVNTSDSLFISFSKTEQPQKLLMLESHQDFFLTFAASKKKFLNLAIRTVNLT